MTVQQDDASAASDDVEPATGVDEIEGEAVGSPSGSWSLVEELYRRHVPDARRYALAISGDPAEADDVVHEAFLRVAARAGTLRRPEAFGAYLRRAVVREVVSRRRSQARARAREERVAAGTPLALEAESDLIDGRLRRALEHLPVRQRTALVLRAWGGWDDRQIAEVLRCRPATVRSLLARARTAIKEDIDDDQDR